MINSTSSDEIKPLSTRHLDQVGKVFEWKGRVFRGIHPDQAGFIRSLLASGLLDELAGRNLIPKTWISDVHMEGFEFLLEHQRIWPVVYPQEWTFSMLRDTALTICEIARIAKGYGYNMKDAHGFNMLFDGPLPKMCDIGSFMADESAGWWPYGEFLECYYFPLRIWQHDSLVGKFGMFWGSPRIRETFFDYEYPFLRLLSPSLREKVADLCVSSALDAQRATTQNRAETAPRQSLSPRTRATRSARWLIPIESFELDKVVARIGAMTQRKPRTQWESYHEAIVNDARRFERIIEILGDVDSRVESAVDLGGNQGRFSRLILDHTALKRVVCIDSDENAIDRGYSQERGVGDVSKLTFAQFDFMQSPVQLDLLKPEERFRTDVVFVLALTHHLVLAQGWQLDEVFKRIGSYARKYVFVEFMPLGLWSAGEQPHVPDWYTLDWFRSSFVRFFTLLHEEKLMTNRVLLVGAVHTA